MDFGIGMFLAGLLSGAGIEWYVALIRIRLAYGDPKDLMRELMLYRGLLYRAGLSLDGDQAGQSSELAGKGGSTDSRYN